MFIQVACLLPTFSGSICMPLSEYIADIQEEHTSLQRTEHVQCAVFGSSTVIVFTDRTLCIPVFKVQGSNLILHMHMYMYSVLC